VKILDQFGCDQRPVDRYAARDEAIVLSRSVRLEVLETAQGMEDLDSRLRLRNCVQRRPMLSADGRAVRGIIFAQSPDNRAGQAPMRSL